jgi:hypothetical protein
MRYINKSREEQREYIREWRRKRKAMGITTHGSRGEAEKKKREIEIGGLPKVSNIAGLTLKDFGF